MKNWSRHIRVLTLLLLILSVAVSSVSFFSDSEKSVSKKELSQEKKKNEEQVSVSSIEAVVPFISVDLIKDLYIILKFDFQERTEEFFNDSEISYTNKYFETLFCFVISPNAP